MPLPSSNSKTPQKLPRRERHRQTENGKLLPASIQTWRGGQRLILFSLSSPYEGAQSKVHKKNQPKKLFPLPTLVLSWKNYSVNEAPRGHFTNQSPNVMTPLSVSPISNIPWATQFPTITIYMGHHLTMPYRHEKLLYVMGMPRAELVYPSTH